MPLTAGAHLGPYEILATIGAGGMGEVYRARDKKLDRDVAIKILPESVAADPERIARFEREAKTLAALNHPNIAQIYGLEDAAGASALVTIGSAFSPDGRWVAYGTSGGVFVQPYPPTGVFRPVPPTGRNPHHPFWSPDGKELFYEPQINELAVVPIRRPLAFGTPVSLPAAGRYGSSGPAFARNRDASGKRFIAPVLASETETGSASVEIRIVLNWFQELKERAPAK